MIKPTCSLWAEFFKFTSFLQVCVCFQTLVYSIIHRSIVNVTRRTASLLPINLCARISVTNKSALKHDAVLKCWYFIVWEYHTSNGSTPSLLTLTMCTDCMYQLWWLYVSQIPRDSTLLSVTCLKQGINMSCFNSFQSKKWMMKSKEVTTDSEFLFESLSTWCRSSQGKINASA